MSTLTSSPPPIGPHRPIDELTRRRPADRPSVARRVATAGLLAALGISLLLSVPALRPVLHAIREISPWWIVAAVTLELASCVSFVVIFRLFFDRVAGRDARALAWTEMASGALLPGGGVGGYALGGVLMRLAGAPTRWIVKRSGGLFFLTSAVNSAAVIGAALLLVAGVSGPHDFARAALPALLAGAATLAVLALPWVARRRHTTLAAPRSARLPRLRHGRPVGRLRRSRTRAPDPGARPWLLDRLPRQHATHPGRHRRARRRPLRRAAALRRTARARHRGRARLSRDLVLDPLPRRSDRLRPPAPAPHRSQRR